MTLVKSETSEYVGMSEACRLVGKSETWVLRMAVRQIVDVNNDGLFTKYSVAGLKSARARYGDR